MGRVRKGEGVSMVKGVEGVLSKSLPGVKKLLHNINTHRYCVPKAQIIWLSNLLILSYLIFTWKYYIHFVSIILNNECILLSRKTF
jgi:hypothetical protein